MAEKHFIRYQPGQTVSNDLILINEDTFTPEPGVILVPFPVSLYPNRYPDHYERQPNNTLVPLGSQPLPENQPDIFGFYTALFNDPLWGVDGSIENPPNGLRVIRPNLAMTQGSMASNLFQPLVIQATWSDLKMGLVGQLGLETASLIIAMVEGHAAIYNIPIVP